jgi:hypothetical protein
VRAENEQAQQGGLCKLLIIFMSCAMREFAQAQDVRRH